jgi:hypothetical protein
MEEKSKEADAPSAPFDFLPILLLQDPNHRLLFDCPLVVLFFEQVIIARAHPWTGSWGCHLLSFSLQADSIVREFSSKVCAWKIKLQYPA